MTRSPRPGKITNLSESTNHQLNMYALAASAAGVGVPALAQPAAARIIYTPTHVVSKEFSWNYKLDVNHVELCLDDVVPIFRFFLQHSTARPGQ